MTRIIAVFLSCLMLLVGAAYANNCSENKGDCVLIQYDFVLGNPTQAPGKIDAQLQEFENIVREKKLGSLISEREDFSIYSNRENSGEGWTLNGSVLYRLESPDKAKQFIQLLQDIYPYDATLYEEGHSC